MLKNILLCLFASLLLATMPQNQTFAITVSDISARPNLEGECRDLFKPGGNGTLPSDLSNTKENSVNFSYVCNIKYPDIITTSLNSNTNNKGGLWNIFDNGFGAVQSVQDIIKTIVNLLLYLTGAAAVMMVIFSGYQFITAAGDEEKIKKAKGILLYSIIGITVCVLAYIIVNFAIKLFN